LTKENKDVVVVPISDLHSGGSTALFPDRFWQFKHTNHTPTSEQVKMYRHWLACAERIREARKGRRLIIVHDGDAIEGIHHNSVENVTRLTNEQMDIHVELMTDFKKAVRFREGDALYYVTGTEVHTEDTEDLIGHMLGAEYVNGLQATEELRLVENGRNLWFVHHGRTPGKGANKGNSLRNFLKDIYHEAVQEGIAPPDYIITGHTHNPYYENYVARNNAHYHILHGLICPAWQQKTRYAYKVAPLMKNKIGMQYFIVTRDGHITEPVEMLME